MDPQTNTATGSPSGAPPSDFTANDVFSPLRDYNVDGVIPELGGVFYWLNAIWNVYSIVAFVISAFFIFGIIYAMSRTSQLGEQQSEDLRAAEKAFAARKSGSAENARWKQVQEHIESQNPNDWRLAIIEADILLEEALSDLGLAGVTIGDKLKGASTEQIKTLDDAWKAHRTRNEIAHAGSDFVLTQRIAQDTISQYQRVFVELGKV